MDDKIKELLAVLDLPEEEQYCWLCKHRIKYGLDYSDIPSFPDNNPKTILVALAFRLRDEIEGVWKNPPGYWIWGEGLQYIYCAVTKRKWDGILFRQWFVYKSKPIHWIIAALIAKELGADTGKAGE